MSLSIGLVGLPNAGKSTLFNALMKKQLAKVAEYPFTTIAPHEGVIDVPDERLDKLTSLLTPEKSTPATITFIDIAGLVKNAHKGEGLGNEFLGQINNVDAILHVVRAFESSEAVHTLGTIDPERDMEIVKTELLLKDLATGGKMAENEKDSEKKAILNRLKEALNQGRMIDSLQFTPEEKTHMKDWQFLTNKPYFYVLNISESQLEGDRIKALEDKDFLVVCAKLEADLVALLPLEQREYLQTAGIKYSGLEKVITEAYSILDLITFYTIKGGKEIRAWPVKKGTTASNAAGVVHTDMMKGFIKAEVISYQDLLHFGSWHKAHELGKVRLEGRDCQINDGEVVEFKFKI